MGNLNMDATTLTAIGTLATAGATATGTLWKWITTKLDAADKKLAACEEKHDECEKRAEQTQREVGEIKHRLGDLEGYLRATMEYRSASDQTDNTD